MRRAGLLNEIIQIYKVNWIKDDYGNQVEDLQLRSTTRAQLFHNNGNRSLQNDEIIHNYNKTFKVRFYVEVDDYDKILFKNKWYRVLSIDPNREFQETIITTELIND